MMLKEHYVKVIINKKRVTYEVCTDKAHLRELIGAVECIKSTLIEKALSDNQTEFELSGVEDDDE